MAYQTRGRDPLFDSTTQAALERRGRELLGLLLMAAGAACAVMLATYSAEDPSWFSPSTEDARNALGRAGASIASPLSVIVGWGGWGFAAALAVWGLRFVVHRGSERALSRIVFTPLAVAALSVYAATHVPGPGWEHSFGLGGLFGDTALAALLNLLGITGIVGLKLVALGVMAATVALTLFALGFTRAEMRAIGIWLIRGSILSYSALLGATGRGASGLARGARLGAGSLARRRAARREEEEIDLLDDAPPVRRGQVRRAEGYEAQDFDEAPGDPAAPRSGWLSGLLGRWRRDPEEEYDLDDDLVEEDGGARIRSRIDDVIGRMRATSAARSDRTEPPALTRREPVLPRRAIAGEDPAGAAALVEEDATGRHLPPSELVDPLVEPAHPDADSGAAAGDRPAPRAKVRKAVQTSLDFEAAGDYEAPPLGLLTDQATVVRHHLSDEALEQNARRLETVLDDYGVKGEIVSVRPGPVVTMYELEPAPGLKASRVIGLADDIARSMSALSARVSTVPGRSVIGIELPNEKREMCVLREILSARPFAEGHQQLPLALGKDIGGDPVVANLSKMPHLLIAGTTGSGKSVAINTMILSLLYRLSPEECRLIMIDPKMLELSVYDGIPHLLSPVVTDPKKAVVALKWVVGEMEDRYRKMSRMGVRNIEGYNGRVRDALSKGELFERTVQTGFDDETGDPVYETEEIEPESMPFIVVIVDEMADLMMVAGKEIEACIQRLAQMARASGIHLIMATQRPSVDVITGTIKANFPTRISFQVTSKIDSRTILGEQGAEQLLGMGDMLYMAGGSRITRVHGPFCSDEEVEEIVNHLKAFGPPDYKSGVVEGPDEDKESDIDAVLGLGGNTDGEDALYDQAVAIVIKDRKCSTSYIQRKLAIGYNKAARLVEQMEDEGVVSSANHVGKREVLVPEPA